MVNGKRSRDLLSELKWTISAGSTTRNLTVIQTLVLTKSNLLSSPQNNIFFLKGILYEILLKDILTLICFSLQFVRTTLRKKIKEKKPNGGWGDKRDHALCLNFTLAG